METLFDPTNNPIHALRLEFGDVDEYDYILTDESYQYYQLNMGDFHTTQQHL